MTREELYVEQNCIKLILELGVPANLQGYTFLKSAVLHAVEEPSLMESVTKKLYPTIAKEFKVNACVIERSIRHVIDVVYELRGFTALNKMFDVTSYDSFYKPTNSELIALLAIKLTGTIKEMQLDDKIDNN